MSDGERSFETLQRALAGRYTIERELGRGGMAVVYLARDLRHDRPVAVKVVHTELAAEVSAERFLHEIEIAARLSHPNIAPLHDSGSAPGLLFYVMPYVQGESLKARITQEGALPVRDALRIAREVADALDYAHRNGIIHRDIKAENVLLSDGHAVVADFGIARAVREAATDRLTMSGIVLGTPGCMSPEQVAGDPVDGRSDVFSLGCVLYEMLAGEPPFTGPTAQAVMAKIIGGAMPSLRTVRPGVSEAVEQLVMRALAREAADRFQTAGEMSAALDGALSAVAPFGSESVHRRGRQWRLRSAGAALVLLTAVVAVAAGSDGVRDAIRIERGPPAPDSTVPFTHDPGLEFAPAVSPDGRFVVYGAGALRAHARLYVRSVRGGRAMPLTDSTIRAPGGPAWSPDGSRIAFHALDGIHIVASFGGGSSRRVVSVAAPSGQRGVGHRAVSTPAWSPDGTRLAYGADSAVWVVSSTGGESRKVTEAPDPIGLRWSPNGRWIAYASRRPAGGSGDVLTGRAIFVVDPNGGQPRMVVDARTFNGSPTWADGGRSLLFVSGRGGDGDVYWLDMRRDGTPRGEPRRITTGTRAVSVSLSDDGRLLAYAARRSTINVVAIGIDTTRVQSIADVRWVTRGENTIFGMALSPDGARLAIEPEAGGGRDIHLVSSRGGPWDQLTEHPGDDFMPTWSPDGRQIAFVSRRDGRRAVYIMNDDGTDQRRVSDGGDHEQYPDWSPDGQRIVYADDKSLHLIARDSTGAFGVPMPLHGLRGTSPRWSPTAKQIAFVGAGGTLLLASTAGGKPKTLWPGPGGEAITGFPYTRGVRITWSPDGRTIYYRHLGTGRWSLWAVPVPRGRPRELLRNTDSTHFSGHMIATDGRELYFTLGQNDSDISLVTLRW